MTRCRRCAFSPVRISIFYGEKLLTTGNPDVERDRQLFARLGLRPEDRPWSWCGERTLRARHSPPAVALRSSPPSEPEGSASHMKRRPLGDVLAELDRQHLIRRRTTIDGFVEPGNRLVATTGGRTLVDFSSNDYLGLAHHRRLRRP